jgi:hypothetical protein
MLAALQSNSRPRYNQTPMTTKNQILAMGLATALIAAPSVFAQPESGSLNFNPNVTGFGGTFSNDLESTSWNFVPANLNLSALASSPDGAGSPNTAFQNGSASWAADGNSGAVSLSIGWNLSGASSANTNVATDWDYSFIATVTGNFEMSYDVTASGNAFGLQGWGISDNFDSEVGGPVLNAIDPSTSGLFVGGVTAGESYNVSLANNGNVSSQGSISLTGSADGNFQWSIVPSSNVPDGGATLAMLGSALTGLAMLRRRFAK